MKDFNISTSLICCDLSNVSADTDAIVCNEGFNWLHADFMDGHFVPRYGISPELIQCLRKKYGSDVIIDSHLMVSDPYTYADVIAPYSDWFFFHYEAVTDPVRTLQMLRKNYKHLKIGLTFNLMSDCTEQVCNLQENGLLDGVMFMGISPGVLGTMSFPDIVSSKIVKLREQKTSNDVKIFIDGSVNYNTVNHYKEIGANVCVSGSSMMFKQPEEKINNRKLLIGYNINKIKTVLS